MGVMSCSRTGCDNIMCDTYISTIGYICSDCKSEFEDYVGAKDKTATEERLLNWLAKFMHTTPKTKYEVKGISVSEFFNRIS